MNVRYEDYVNNGTKFLLAMLSAPEIEEEERELIVDSFANQLREHICASSDFDDYEYLAFSTSLAFSDEKIALILSNPQATYVDCEKALKLCVHEKKLVETFEKKQWKLPKLINKDLEKVESNLQKRQANISASARVLELDTLVEKSLKKIYKEYSVQACDAAQEAVKELGESLTVCKKQKVEIPLIRNKDIKDLNTKIANLRKESLKKEEIHRKAVDVDSKIHDIVELPSSTPTQWAEVVALCRQQQGFMDECKVKQWPLPVIQYDNLSDLEDRYTLYQRMGAIDSELATTAHEWQTWRRSLYQFAQLLFK